MSPRTKRAHLGLDSTDLGEIIWIAGERPRLYPETFGPSPSRSFRERLPNDLAAVGAVGREFPQGCVRRFVATERNGCHAMSVTRMELAL